MRTSTIVIGLAALCFAGYVFYSLFHLEPVVVESKQLERSGGEVFVAGELKNTGKRTGPLKLEVHYYDRGGHQLAGDTVKVAAMAAGATATFKTPSHRLNGVSDFSLYLNHGRNPYGN
ncbi:MAG: FxLYD domain-containing protein [Candidatus Binataceae bacterium]